MSSSLAGTFYSDFQSQRNAISAFLESAKTDPNAIQSARTELLSLRKSISDAIAAGYLPKHDQGQCESQVRTLEQEIESLRSSAAPKRFAFRRPTPQKVVQSTPSPLSAPAVLITAQSLPKALPDLASTHLSLSNQENTLLTLESLPAPLPAKSDLTISEIDSCVINLLPFSAESLEITALHVRNLKRTVLFAPFIKGSILLHDCVDCILVLGCHQYRMHNSRNTRVYLHVTSFPVIEGCDNIQFGPYILPLPETVTSISKYDQIQDFHWIRDGPSPNWRTISGDNDYERGMSVYLYGLAEKREVEVEVVLRDAGLLNVG